RDLVLLVSQVLYALNSLYQYGVDTVKILPEVVIGDLEQLALGIVQQIEDICAVLIRIPDDLAADADKLPLDEFLQDDPGMGLDIGGGNDGIGEFGHEIGPAHHLQLLPRFQLFDDREDID